MLTDKNRTRRKNAKHKVKVECHLGGRCYKLCFLVLLVHVLCMFCSTNPVCFFIMNIFLNSHIVLNDKKTHYLKKKLIVDLCNSFIIHPF